MGRRRAKTKKSRKATLKKKRVESEKLEIALEKVENNSIKSWKKTAISKNMKFKKWSHKKMTFSFKGVKKKLNKRATPFFQKSKIGFPSFLVAYSILD